MPATTRVIWRPQPLHAAIARANRVSFEVAHQDALARRHNKSKSGIEMATLSDNTAVMQPTGLQAMFERGRRGGYEVKPKGSSQVLAVRSGPAAGYYAVVTGGPMAPRPAMGPAARDWAMGGYHPVARGVLGASGFR